MHSLSAKEILSQAKFSRLALSVQNKPARQRRTTNKFNILNFRVVARTQTSGCFETYVCFECFGDKRAFGLLTCCQSSETEKSDGNHGGGLPTRTPRSWQGKCRVNTSALVEKKGQLDFLTITWSACEMSPPYSRLTHITTRSHDCIPGVRTWHNPDQSLLLAEAGWYTSLVIDFYAVEQAEVCTNEYMSVAGAEHVACGCTIKRWSCITRALMSSEPQPRAEQ